MSSDEEEEPYEVERILAEKVQDGVTKYLVKWSEYPDEECTWEPIRNFDTSEILDLWKQQKADGDVLEKEDLRRLQLRMDAFKAAQSADDGASEYSSEGESNPEFEENIQPPAKRVKLVHDPTPLSNKSRHTKATARTGRAVAERDETVRSPISRKTGHSKGGKVGTVQPLQKPKQDTMSVAVQSRIPHLKTANITESLANKSTRRPSKSTATPPTTFHAPELSQRKRTPSNAKRDAAGAVGKPFKNLRHLNNARKKQAESFEHLAATPTSNILVEQDEGPTQITGQGPEQANESWLFFSDDETGGSGKSKNKVRNTELGPLQDSEQQKKHVGQNANQAKIITPEEHADREQATIPLASPNFEANPTPTKVQENDGRESQGIQSARRLMNASPKPGIGEATQDNEASPTIIQTENDIHEITLHSRSISGLDRHKTIDTEDPARTAMPKETIVKDAVPTVTKVPDPGRGSSISQPAPAVAPTTAVTANLPTSRAPQSMITVEAQPPQWQPRHDPTTGHIHPSREQALKGGIVRTPGRSWMKGDLVVELYLDGQLAGGVKIQNQPWHFGSPIVRLKPKTEHTLPIHFYGIKYDDYLARSKQASWWTISAVGAVEAFPDSEIQLSAMAAHLETHDLGACWWHPDPTVDLMLILYSCRSRSWAEMSTRQQTRSGEIRLNIAFRNKFKEFQSVMIQPEVPATREDISRIASEDRDIDMTDVRTDFRREPRSRRASIVSSSSSRTYEDTIMSPSEQLAREMADHALNARSRHASNATDGPVRPLLSLKATPRDIRQGKRDVSMAITACPKEHDSPITSTDPRVRAVDPRRELAANRVTPSPVNHQSRKDTIAGQLHISAANSPIERDKNPCLDRSLKELSQRPFSNSSRETRRDMKVLRVYKSEDLRKAQEVQEWLAEQMDDSNNMQIQSVDTALDDKQEAWKNFKSSAKSITCLLICDVSCPIYRFDGLGRLMNHNDNLICWQVDLNDTTNKPLMTTRLFPTGWAMGMTHDCFLMDPEDALYALKWLKKRAEKPLPASVLILPPHISSSIQEQAFISSLPETKSLFLKLATVVQQLIALSETQIDGLRTPRFTVILPRWEDVYSNNVPISNQLSAIEQKLRDKTMSDEFLKYFGAWAMRNLTKHRGFLGLTMNEKPHNNEHVRFRRCNEFVMADKDLAKQAREKEKEKERQRSRSRDLSAGRDHDRARGRSRDGNDNDKARIESGGRG